MTDACNTQVIEMMNFFSKYCENNGLKRLIPDVFKPVVLDLLRATKSY